MHAQGPADGALRGRVTLPGGAAAAGADVSLLDQDGMVVRRLILGRDGRFLLLRIPPGSYEVQARLPGFAETLRPPDATVSVGGGDLDDVDLQFRLIVPGFTLHSRSPGIQGPANRSSATENSVPPSGPSLQANASAIDRLPLPARDWEGVAALDSSAADATPSAATDSEAEPESEPEAARDAAENDSPGSGLSYSGLPSTQNSFQQDGLSAEQGFRSGPRGASLGGPRAGSSFGQAAVRTLRVLPSTFSAQRGSAGGAVLSLSSERGEARLHGSAFAFFRQSAWAAVNPYSLVQHYSSGLLTNSLVRPDDREQQFGAAAGLPLTRLHLGRAPGRDQGNFPALFASLEYQRHVATTESSPSAPGFYALTPTQVALLGTRGISRAETQAALNYLDGLSGPIPHAATRILGFARLDTPLGTHDQLGLAFQANRFGAPAGAQISGSSSAVLARGRGSVGDTSLSVSAISGRWLHTFRPGLSHDLRGQWAHDLEFETPHAPLASEPAIGPGGLAPEIDIAPSGFVYGTPASFGRTAYPDEHRTELADTFLIAAGRHLLTVGADWSRLDDRIASLANTEGTFLYDSSTTKGHAGGLVDWITDYTFNVNTYPNGGCPTIYSAVHDFCFRSFSQSFAGTQSSAGITSSSADTRFITHQISAFAEDALRPTHALTLTLGVRLDYTLLPIPQSPNRKLDSAFASLAGAATGSTAVFPEDRNNFGPRFALAWAPRRGRLFTAHAGYGVFFGRLPGATVRAALANTALPTTTSSIRIVPTTETVCPQVANQGFGYPCTYVSAPPAAVAATTSATEFAHNFRLPAVQRASFSLERAAGRHLFFSAAYAMASATQLPLSVDRNIAPATSGIRFVLNGGDGMPGLHTGDIFQLPLYTSRLSTSYGPITTVVSSANATYHAVTLEGRLQGSSWVTLRGNFTFSRAIDYAPQLGATPRLNGRLDPYTPGYDKGLSSLNFPQRFAGDLILRSPYEHTSTPWGYVLGGWRLAALATAGSGAPYSYEIFGGTRLSGGHESLNGAGGATYLPTVGRNTLHLPARSRVDLRLGREIPLHAHTQLEAFAQAFNVLNSRNLARVETRAFLLGTPAAVSDPTPLIFQSATAIASEGLSTPAFGQALSSTTGLSRERLLEVGLRLTF